MRVMSIVACLGIVGAAEEASGQIANYKLSGPLVAGGDVAQLNEPGFTPDSKYFLYVADQDTDEIPELFRVPLAGGAPVKMNHPLPPLANVKPYFQIAPDGSHVLYQATVNEFSAPTELYSVPIEDGLPVSLTVPPAVDVSDYFITSDSRTVAVRHGNDIYSISIAGGPPTQLDAVMESEPDIEAGSFQISPDGDWVVFDSSDAIFSSPIHGGELAVLSPVRSWRSFSFDPPISPDSTRVVYVARPHDAGPLERNLYSVPIEGGPITKLFPPPGMDAFRADGEWVYSGNGRRVIFLAHDTTPFPNETPNNLYSVHIEGGVPIRLNPPLFGDTSVSSIFLTNPHSDRVVFGAHLEGEERGDLYSVPALGGEAVPLNVSLSIDQSIMGQPSPPQITPDGARVVYGVKGPKPRPTVTKKGVAVYSVPIGGGTSIKVNEGPLVEDGITGFVVSPDSSMVAYRAQTTFDHFELFAVPITGGPVVKVNGELVEFGNVWDDGWPGMEFTFSPDSSTVVYIADQEQDEVYEYFATKIREVVPPEVPAAGSYALAALALGLALAGASSVARHSAARGKSSTGSSGGPYLRAGLLAMAAPGPEARDRKRDDKSA